MDVFEPAADFNRRIIGIEAPREPTPLTKERRRAIANHLREEAQELEDAEDLADQVDALTDLIFIAAGRFYETGTDGPAHYAETSRANRSRVRGDNPKRPDSFGYDAVKPAGWREPNHRLVIDETRLRGWLDKPHPKIILLGHARHGKDTVAELLRDEYGFKFQSSSMFCAEHVVRPAMERELGITYDSLEACYADRVNWRSVWFDLIEGYNTPDKGRLCRELFEAGNDVYVGMRSAEEFAAARWFAEHVIWVDRSDHCPPEDASSCTVTRDMADHVLDNNGTLEDLKRELFLLMQEVL